MFVVCQEEKRGRAREKGKKKETEITACVSSRIKSLLLVSLLNRSSEVILEHSTLNFSSRPESLLITLIFLPEKRESRRLLITCSFSAKEMHIARSSTFASTLSDVETRNSFSEDKRFGESNFMASFSKQE